jgi:hypothetical protein
MTASLRQGSTISPHVYGGGELKTFHALGNAT